MAGSVREAVERDLAELGRRAPALASSGLAAMALALAGEIDNPGNSATSKSMCAKSLSDALSTLRGLAPPEVKSDRIDELGAQRARRRARRAAS